MRRGVPICNAFLAIRREKPLASLHKPTQRPQSGGQPQPAAMRMQHVMLRRCTTTHACCRLQCHAPRTLPLVGHCPRQFQPHKRTSHRRVVVQSQKQGNDEAPIAPAAPTTPAPGDPPSLKAAAAALAAQLRAVLDAAAGFLKLVISYITQVRRAQVPSHLWFFTPFPGCLVGTSAAPEKARRRCRANTRRPSSCGCLCCRACSLRPTRRRPLCRRWPCRRGHSHCG